MYSCIWLREASWSASKNCRSAVARFISWAVSFPRRELACPLPTNLQSYLTPSQKLLKTCCLSWGSQDTAELMFYGYTELTQPIRDMVKQQGMRNLKAQLVWTVQAETAFNNLKRSLATASELATPDYSSPFFFDVSGTAVPKTSNGVANCRA